MNKSSIYNNRLPWRFKGSMGGFNLLELIITVSITGVLAGLIIPSYISQIGKARAAEGKTTLGRLYALNKDIAWNLGRLPMT